MDDKLPLSDPVHGIIHMCPPKRLHISSEYITVYMFDCLRNIIGDKGVGKTLIYNNETVDSTP